MNKILYLTFFLLFSLNLWSQENQGQDKITLKTGDVYTGKIVSKTNEMIMITTKDGTRYQFQLSEVKKMENESETVIAETEKSKSNEFTFNTGNFGGMIEFAVGISKAKYSFEWAPNTQLSIAFGNKKILGQNLFLGVGVGYNSTFVTSNSQTLSFLPIFIHIQSTLTKKRTSPYLGMDAGYAFALSSGYGGGTLAKISVGISHKISYKTILSAGLYAGVQAFSGTLTEKTDLGTFIYDGKTTMNTFGAKIGLQF